MFKRIRARCTEKSVKEINAENYTMPTLDERENPGKSWKEVVKTRDLQNAFKGEFQCKLCPKKVLHLQKDLNEHLQAKGHKLALARYYKANE